MKDNSKKQVDCQTVIYFSVYVLWCRKTDKHYVGVTRQRVTTRIGQHKRGKRQFLDKEIQKIGWENFDWWIVEENVPSEQVSECEKKWIKFFDCVFPHGYNKTCGGISNITMSEDSCNKIREKALARNMSGENNPFYGKHHTEEYVETLRMRHGEKHPCYGRRHTEEELAKMRGKKHDEKARANMSRAHLGKPLSEEHKAKMRGRKLTEEHKAKLRGRKHTAEEKAKIREAHTGKKCTEETKAKIRKKLTGRKLTEEHKAKIGVAVSGEKNGFFGRHHTEESRAKMRLAHAAKRAAKAAAQTTP